MNFDLTDNHLVFIIPALFVAILAAFGIITWVRRSKRISTRINHFVAPEVQSASNTIRTLIIPREIRGSLYKRTIVSWFKKALQFLGKFTPEKMAVDMEHKLTIAGNPSNLHARNFFAIRVLSILGGIILSFLVNLEFMNLQHAYLIFKVLTAGITSMMPNVWLDGRVRNRQDEIRRSLPDALDMLSVCASAGLGFDQSMQKISNHWDTELGTEFERATREMEMGVSRATALKNMRDRLEVDDLSQFIAILTQAEKIGMSYADVLHSQADQLRSLRQVRAREIANKLPAKMLIPVILFIFPALIAVILGPSVPILMNMF